MKKLLSLLFIVAMTAGIIFWYIMSIIELITNFKADWYDWQMFVSLNFVFFFIFALVMFGIIVFSNELKNLEQ